MFEADIIVTIDIVESVYLVAFSHERLAHVKTYKSCSPGNQYFHFIHLLRAQDRKSSFDGMSTKRRFWYLTYIITYAERCILYF